MARVILRPLVDRFFLPFHYFQTRMTTTTRIGIQGFGLLGRSLFRLSLDRPEIEIGAVAETADPEMLRYLLQFSTLPWRYDGDVALDDGSLSVNGVSAPVVRAGGAGEAPWADLGVTTVVDFRDTQPTRSELEGHLAAGAERVVLCAPPGGQLDRTVVMGLNEDRIEASDRIVSAGSFTAHCAGPLLRILDGAFGVEQAFISSVRAYGAGSRLADVPAPEPRKGRAAGENIIPAATGAAEELATVLPELEGKLSASAMDVPVANGSVVDLVCWHRDSVTVDAVNDAVAAAAGGEWSGRLRFEREAIVSADTVGSRATCIFDSQATMTLGERVSKTIAWFDNGWGYLHRLVELLAVLDGAASAQGDDS
ncbi:MAG: type I glyceraldehyde-3-phosphate dehydrogenase [Holophagales bacterium]|nr:type I glyceraldehyde-3-phosphate dehydrogenase [Holophagales bacterium]